MEHTHKQTALRVALFTALPSSLIAVLILTATGVTRDAVNGARMRLTELSNVASGNMPVRSAAPAVKPAARSASSRSRVKLIAPALQTATPPSAADTLPEKKSAYVPEPGERTIDVSDQPVYYNFQKHAADKETPDVVFRRNSNNGVDIEVYEEPNLKRNDARLSYSNGSFAEVTLDICLDAVKSTWKTMELNAFSTQCVETAEGRLIKIGIHPSFPLAVRYIVLDERTAPPKIPSGPEAAEGVIELLGKMTNYDPAAGTYSYKGDLALFLEKAEDDGGGGPRIEVTIPEKMRMSSVSKSLKDVTEKDCQASDSFDQKTGSKSRMSWLREKGKFYDSVLCVRFTDGRFAVLGDSDYSAGRVKIRFLRMDTDRGPGKGGFSLDQWEKEHPVDQATLDFLKEYNADPSPSKAYVDFSHRTGRVNGDGPFDLTFSGDSRTLYFEAAWNKGKPETAFVFPWTPYDRTTADVCAKAFADGFGSRKIAIGDVDAAVCFRTGDGYVGKMKRSSGGERAIAYELWQKTVNLPSGPAPVYGENSARLITLQTGQFFSYEVSKDVMSTKEQEIDQNDLVALADSNGKHWVVAGGLYGSVRLAETDEGMEPTYEACRKALTTKAIDPYGAELKLIGNKTYVCFETMDGWVGAVQYVAGLGTLPQMIGAIYTWRKPSAPATPGVTRVKATAVAAKPLPPLNKTITLNIFRPGEKGEKGSEYKHNNLSVLLRLQPDGTTTITKQVPKERCNRVFKRGWKKKCWIEGTTPVTETVEAFSLLGFAPLTKLVPVTGITYDALTQDTCRSLANKQQAVARIEKVSADTVACIAEPGGRVGKVGKFNGSTMTIFIW
ncbi:MAG: hypothetical protein WC840_00415 [Candidatus Peribacteraceae bacterium]